MNAAFYRGGQARLPAIPNKRRKRMGEMQQGVQFRFAGPEDTCLLMKFIKIKIGRKSLI